VTQSAHFHVAGSLQFAAARNPPKNSGTRKQ